MGDKVLTDLELENLWKGFWGNLHKIENPETGLLIVEYLHFPVGTDVVDEIWAWFDERHSKGITYLTTQLQIK